MDLHRTGRLLLDRFDKDVYHVHLEAWLFFYAFQWKVVLAYDVYNEREIVGRIWRSISSEKD